MQHSRLICTSFPGPLKAQIQKIAKGVDKSAALMTAQEPALKAIPKLVEATSKLPELVATTSSQAAVKPPSNLTRDEQIELARLEIKQEMPFKTRQGVLDWFDGGNYRFEALVAHLYDVCVRSNFLNCAFKETLAVPLMRQFWYPATW